ncbi:poly [ADP-ribose] polymerase 1 [Cyclospora cayetanensis]|uniref:Poly [ADP-ribose] polymerase n=1 Tax=Cyclospora cayetanensis TaxID=88456 RepID=A0A6P6RXQ4_9EIME|nr:poly [ADP-ribose] polymerase 1 [Cyclospora cayetanensis]
MAPRTNPAPIPNPFSIDYAPTDRAICKGCDGRIGLDSLRFIRKVWSRFHDGFDELKYHLRCGKKFTDNLEDIRYALQGRREPMCFHGRVCCDLPVAVWQALRWNDILRVSKSFNVKINEEHPAVQAVRRRSDAIWSLKAMLMEVPKKQLLSILDANSIPYNEKKISIGEAAHIVADGFMFGRFPPCPICSNSTLVQDEAKRFPVFKKWKCPVNVEGCMQLGNPLSSPSPKVLKEENAATDAVEIPPGMELVGLSFTSVGTTDPSKQDLQVSIERHGGEYTDHLESRTTFLLVGDGDAYQFTKKYRDAQAAGVPIVHCAFVRGLIRRKDAEPKLKLADCRKWKGPHDGPDPRPTGLLLRKKKYAQYYVVEGKLAHELPSAAEGFRQLRKNKERSSAKVKRPAIAKDAPILQVDPLFSKKGGKIFIDELGNAFNCCTQFTDITTGINKYYAMQIVQTGKTYHFFTKWGRLGADDKLTNDYRQQSFGQDVDSAIRKILAPLAVLSALRFLPWSLRKRVNLRIIATYHESVAAEAFETKFQGLTGTHWDDRFSFVQQPGRYGFVELAGYETAQKAKVEPLQKRLKTEEASASSCLAECTLQPEVKVVIELIFDRNLAEKLLKEQHLNLQKLPIESISKKQLQEGYAVLQEIQNLLREDAVQTSTLKYQTKLADATNRFYIKIPHIFTYAQKPPILDSLAKLRTKIEMMEQLLELYLPLKALMHPLLSFLLFCSQVSVAQSLLTDALLNAKDRHPLDAQYDQLCCKLEPLPEGNEERQLVCRLISNTHAPTHNTWKLKERSVFKCDRKGETERFNREMGNRMLLWHGSRLTNWPSILAKGLQVAPPEAPSSGYMFDKGIYFADMVSKASQYCFASSQQPHGLLVLCEAALGNQRQLLGADYEAAAKCKADGEDSVHGVGRMCPNPEADYEVPSVVDGKAVRVCGGKSWNNSKAVDVVKAKTPGSPEAALMYNEYVVYDPRQVKIRYLIHVEFEFASFDLDDL